ncbi:ABC transporter ATP-binding protein [Candidatus Woesearchaeota archaeon]|jgi:ABC-2 type transport system ATP-binding protein|nr:ABC transporter ATP-binding protein [Candidatus Woesearchaeota archaeon]
MNSIEIKNLRKNYNGVKAVNNISFEIKQGDIFGFIGPNGAGKTTTINSIVGLVKFKGKISVFGNDVIHDYKEARKKIGLSPQELNFDRFLSVEECLLYTAGYFGIKKEIAKKRTLELLKEFYLFEKRKVRIDYLSGGMKRRLLIARALVHDPEILILDEPTAGLDVELRHELWDMLKKINKEGKTIIITSHYIEEIEALCKTVCIIHKGKILALGDKDKIMEKLSNQTLQLKTDTVIPKNILLRRNLKVTQEGKISKITGKNIKKKAKDIITRIEKAGIKIKEIDIVNEKLETVFLRLTKEKK